MIRVLNGLGQWAPSLAYQALPASTIPTGGGELLRTLPAAPAPVIMQVPPSLMPDLEPQPAFGAPPSPPGVLPVAPIEAPNFSDPAGVDGPYDSSRTSVVTGVAPAPGVAVGPAPWLMGALALGAVLLFRGGGD